MLRNIDDERLRIYLIWMPLLRGDTRIESVERSTEFDDSRLTHYWDDDRLSGNAWAEALSIDGVAWDIYFLYGPDATWAGGPPEPDFWMHQLGGLKDRAPRLELEPFESETKNLLTKIR